MPFPFQTSLFSEKEKAHLHDYSGILYVEKFGEEPFSPVSNEARATLSDDQQGLYQDILSTLRLTVEEYIPEKERSFKGISDQGTTDSPDRP